MENANRYQEVVKKAEQDVADEVRRFINGEIDDEGNAVKDGGPHLNPGQRPTKLRASSCADTNGTILRALWAFQCDRLRQRRQHRRLRAGGVL